MEQPSISTKLILLVAVLSALLMGVGIFTAYGLAQTRETLRTVYEDRTVPIWQIGEIHRQSQRIRFLLATSVDPQLRIPLPELTAELTTLNKSVDTLLAAYMKTFLTPEEKPLADRLLRNWELLVRDTQQPVLAALRSNNLPEAQRLMKAVGQTVIPEMIDDLRALTALQVKVAQEQYDAASVMNTRVQLATTAAVLLGLAFAVIFGGLIVATIRQSSRQYETSRQANRDLERQLQQAQKMQAIGQLTGGIAHDFNNILAAVLGYSNLALKRFGNDRDPKLAQYLREIISASERARDLVSKMLTFASTRPSQVTEAVSPAAILHEVQSMLRPSIASSIALAVQIDEDAPLLVDAGELNQMVVNLVINARDAIDGAGRIEMRLRRVQLGGELCAVSHERLRGSFLALEVSDTGSGIRPQDLPRLFDPFFTTKEVGKGTGLGLSMVQGIVRRAGGHVLVDSQPGRGSRFTLLFRTEAAVGVTAPNGQDLGEVPKGRGQLCWVVEDEPAIARYLHELLQGHDYRVRLFDGPAEALALFESGPVDADVLITDQTMPGTSGAALAARALALYPHLPVVLCTGSVAGLDVQALHAIGVRKVLVKPVPAGSLLATIADALAGTPAPPPVHHLH